MQERLRQRLTNLKADFQLGQTKLQELEGQVNTLRNNLLRLSGAIQVLEEELAEADGASAHNAEEPSASETPSTP